MKASMAAFADELIKISSAGQVAGALAKHWKYPAVGGGAVATYLTGKQAKEDWQLGRAVRKQHEQRGG